MKLIIKAILVLTVFLYPAYSIYTAAQYSDPQLEQLKKISDFKLLTPKSLSESSLEIKEPYPLNLSEKVTMVRLHYFENEKLKVGITQHKLNNYKTIQEEIIVNFGTGDVEIKKVAKEFVPDFSTGEKVNINGNEARFVPWGQKEGENIPGGILFWGQEGTYIEMDSSSITKREMIKIAKSMQ
ncbi:DUF4367 domain-containing protein [Anaerobacillus isosaccharinicus]|uniref:DUF4367 domain-containing protein n=1 Tax=Anaerobacillus isosaccharinicus TaxID=1532552 RepID=A0A7S7L655_9BACI|nr:DUF4367 domain-containing protein [Anaerobacillus isosaccharinicus]